MLSLHDASKVYLGAYVIKWGTIFDYCSGCRNVSQMNVITNSPSQDYAHPDDHTRPAYDMTRWFKPFRVILFT